MFRKIIVFFLIFLPPALILLIGVSASIFSFDWTLTGAVTLGWVTFLAAVFQILGFDMKTFLSSGNMQKRKSLEKSDLPVLASTNEAAATISEKDMNQIIKDASEIFASPLILFKTLSPVSDEQPIKFSELRVVLDCNIHILRSRINKLQALGLIEILDESVKRTVKGKFVAEFLKDRFVK